ncbi:MAG: chemotaxis protein CheW [Oleibacter sp.]|nr:chemotaxis protein CheW [Thalassolituus sp.]
MQADYFENQSVTQQELPDEQSPSIDCLMVSIRSGHLILPNASVAEIIPFSHLLTTNARADWILGRLDWRGTLVPAVCYELLNGSAPPTPNADARFIVINGMSGNDQLPFYAILVQGIPRLVHVQESDIQPNEEMNLGNLDKVIVRVNDVDAAIPDLEKLESEMIIYVRN